MIPVIVRPSILSALNSWKKSGDKKRKIIRDGILVVFALLVAYAIARGTFFTLKSIQEVAYYAYVPSTLPLNLILLSLSAVLLLSSLVSASGYLYLSEDLDLLLSKPVSFFRFFAGRYIQIVGGTTWMPSLFVSPLIISYGIWFQMPLEFYIVALVVMIPFLLIPPSLGILISTLLLAVFPAKRIRGLAFLALGAFLGCIYMLLDLLQTIWSSMNDSLELLKVIRVLTLSNIPWLPSSWVSTIFREIIEPTGRGFLPGIATLYLALAASLSGAYAVTRMLHFSAVSQAASSRRRIPRRAYAGKSFRIFGFLGADHRALISKDIRLLTRDLTQILQGLLLAGIYVIYIYNLRVYTGFSVFDSDSESWWRMFMFISNFCVSSFITSALCTRFVFPTVSLEGKGWWIIVKAPIRLNRYVYGKFWSWYIPIAIIGAIVSGTGVLAIGGSMRAVALNSVSIAVCCIGLVGLATGLGATFSRFDWESPTQLAVGFGNLVFMLVSTVLILVDLVPIWMLLFLHPHSILPTMPAFIYYGTLSLFLVLLNVVIARRALSGGLQALEARRN